MDSFTADFSQLARLHGPSLPPPRYLPNAFTSGTNKYTGDNYIALLAGLRMGMLFKLPVASLLEIAVFGTKPPKLFTHMPTTMPVGFDVSRSGFLTISNAFSETVAAVIGITGSAGLYGSSTREVGAFVSYGPLICNNIGVSAGVEACYILGTPSDFKGLFYGVGVGVSPACLPIAIGGMLLFSASAWSPVVPHVTFTLMGFSIAYSVGPSVLPVTVTLDVTNTKTWPLLRF